MSKTTDQPAIGAVVLAAGGSSRLGHPKQLVEFQGKPLVWRAAEAARDAGLDPVVVVAGAESEKVLAAILDLSGITPCVNTEWKSGLASSLRLGLKTVRELKDVDGVLVTVVDQPRITARLLGLMIDAFTSGNRIVAASYDGVLGVPAVFGQEYFNDLERLTGDKGAGSWLRARAGHIKSVPIGLAAFDIDTQADLDRLLAEGKVND